MSKCLVNGSSQSHGVPLSCSNGVGEDGGMTNSCILPWLVPSVAKNAMFAVASLDKMATTSA